MTAPPTSIRLTEDERELLDAFAAYMSVKRGINLNRTQAIKHLMRKAQPPTEAGPEAARFRRAYSIVFGAKE
jgi:hypothetical protein